MSSTRHILLGLLSQQPMSGYDIRSMFSGLRWLADTPSYGSLYPTLHALLEEGLVTVNVEPGEGKPPKKLYSLTEAGHAALRSWLQKPSSSEFSIKAFVRQLIMAGSLSSDELKAHLVKRRAQVIDYLSRPEHGEDPGEELRDDLGRKLAHDYGAAIAKAELDWLDSQLAELGRSPSEGHSA